MGRRAASAIALATAVLVLTDSRSDGATDIAAGLEDQPLRVALRESAPVADAGLAELELPRRAAPEAAAVNLFSRHSWYVAPPPPPPPPPSEPAAPTAPPLPFIYMGQYEEQGGVTVFFLQRGDRVYDVRQGEVIDGTYSVDGESGGQLMFTYLPLGTAQGLPVGPAS